MRKLFTSFFLFFAAISWSQANLIGNGGFELFDQGWILSGDVYADYGACQPHGGDNYLWFGDYDEVLGVNLNSGTALTYFIVPANALNASMNFFASVVSDEQDQINAYDWLDIAIRDENGNDVYNDNLNNIYASLLVNDCDSWFESGSINISPDYFGQTLSLSFVADTDETLPTIFRVDDVTVTATTSTGTVELPLTKGNTRVWMQQESSILNVNQPSGLIRDLTIYNTLGQEVLHTTIAQQTNSYDLSALSSGIYLVQIPGEAPQRIRR